jgi:hypothetical protein
MKLVKSLMKQGVDKGEIFARAIDQGLNPKKVSRYLSGFPDKSLSEKYHKANIIFLSIYGALVFRGIWSVYGMLSESPLKARLIIFGVIGFFLIIIVALMYLIYKKRAVGYMALLPFLIKGISNAFKGYEQDPLGSLAAASMVFGLIAFLIILKNKIFSYQNFFNTKKTGHGIYIFSRKMADEALSNPQLP